ncbi:MAG TPA: winged helix-turn-helix domain-containing protein [Nitrososphaerales archaeon]|nr:winged helix-turn-helix domain-containing protein [Nitrososphaerales archaeon]
MQVPRTRQEGLTSTLVEERLQSSKRKRGWIEIIWLILSHCVTGSVKTRIMYRCNLNSKQIQQYLSFLLECEFLEGRKEESHITKSYYTTESGLTFIRKYQQLQEVLEAAISHTRVEDLAETFPS